MGLFDKEYSFDKLVRTTSAGVEVSSFVQIKNAVIRRYKEIYGNDIDIETTSADGQYIMMLSLLLYNGYNGLVYLDSNLDPASATGKFLDILCGLNNVFRENQTNSYAYLYVRYTGTNTEGFNPMVLNNTQQIQCLDQANRIWTWVEGKGADNFATNFKPNKIYILKFECEESGPIETYADPKLKNVDKNEIKLEDLKSSNHGDISRVLDPNTFPFSVWQADDAVVGTYDETDEALRSRLNYERGNTGITVSSGLLGGLLGIIGVEESKLYNNNTAVSMTANDGTTIATHDVYVITRYKKNAEINKSSVGDTIANKLTPGIVTTEYEGSLYGENQSYDFYTYENVISFKINWKKCLPAMPSMEFQFKARLKTYDETTKEPEIINCLKKYCFNLTIYDDLNIPELISELNASDTLINNQHTYLFYNGTVETNTHYESSDGGKIMPSNSNTIFNNADTYYDYSDYVDINTINLNELTSDTYYTRSGSAGSYTYALAQGEFDTSETYYINNEESYEEVTNITSTQYYASCGIYGVYEFIKGSEDSNYQNYTLKLYKL